MDVQGLGFGAWALVLAALAGTGPGLHSTHPRLRMLGHDVKTTKTASTLARGHRRRRHFVKPKKVLRLDKRCVSKAQGFIARISLASKPQAR